MSAALPPLRAPDPALLDLAPVGDAGAAEGKGAADAAVASGGGEEEAGLIKLGPLTLATGGLHRQFRLRQKYKLSDKIRASVGAFYSFNDGRVGPTASITYMLDDRCRFELNERHALIKKKWVLSRGGLSLGLGAECRLVHGLAYTGLPPLGPRRPEVHLSLDHIKPLRYEAIGIGLVLLSNLPFSLRDKEVEAASVASRLLGFARATVKRTGYAQFKLDISELAGVLDVS